MFMARYRSMAIDSSARACSRRPAVASRRLQVGQAAMQRLFGQLGDGL